MANHFESARLPEHQDLLDEIKAEQDAARRDDPAQVLADDLATLARDGHLPPEPKQEPEEPDEDPAQSLANSFRDMANMKRDPFNT